MGKWLGVQETTKALLEPVREVLTSEQYASLQKSIAEDMQRTFDIGYKAAGGTMLLDTRGNGLLELVLDQEEIDTLGDLRDFHICAGFSPSDAPYSIEALERFYEKIGMFVTPGRSLEDQARDAAARLKGQ